MNAKPYTDAEIAERRKNPLCVYVMGQEPRLDEREQRWLATADALKSLLASAEADCARNMKAALAWDAQAIGKALGMKVGTDVPGAVVPAIEAIKARLASAEAEVVRLRALLEPKRPYEPKVGDVATPTPAPGQVWGWADGESGEWVLVRPEHDWESHGRWFIYSITYDCMTRASYFGIDAPKGYPSVAKKYLRPATPAERAAAGLPPEDAVDTAAVARRDGGGK